MKKNSILLVGGGTGGHIFPLRNLADAFLKKQWDVTLVALDAPLDRMIVTENFSDIPHQFLRTGKFDHFLSWRNLLAPFKIFRGIFQAFQILNQTKPRAVFFKGGFVGFPFLVALLWKNLGKNEKIKIYNHESDIVPGLQTKLTNCFSDSTFSAFGDDPSPLFYQPKRTNRLNENATKKPKLLIFGGSQGAVALNELFHKNSAEILQNFSVLLVAGPGKLIDFRHADFTQTELLPVHKLSAEIFTADLIVARAGANSLFEIISAKKPSVIVPLPSAAHDHQRKNARFFAKKNVCAIYEENCHDNFVSVLIKSLKSNSIKRSLKASQIKNSAEKICEIIAKN